MNDEFEKNFPSLKGRHTEYCKSPEIDKCFSIPEHWRGRLFDSENIEKNCLDKQRVKEAIEKRIEFYIKKCSEISLETDTMTHSSFINKSDELKSLLKELGLQ